MPGTRAKPYKRCKSCHGQGPVQWFYEKQDDGTVVIAEHCIKCRKPETPLPRFWEFGR